VSGYEETRGAMDAWTFGFKHVARGYDVGLVPGTWYLHRNGRDARPSYWTRDQELGRNDPNAIATVQQYLDWLPSDLAVKAAMLNAQDRFFELIDTGSFNLSPDEFARRLRSMRRTALISRVRRHLTLGRA
jgi:hypothetical protein